MPHVVYALFEDAELADRVRTALCRRGADGPGLDVQPHEGRLDANQLPESATTYGRNLAVSTAIGALFFASAGGILGFYDVVTGMSPGMGVILGVITGLVVGVYTAMQAGTRVAKASIGALAPRLTEGAVLLTIEVSTREEAERLVDRLDEYEADDCGIC